MDKQGMGKNILIGIVIFLVGLFLGIVIYQNFIIQKKNLKNEKENSETSDSGQNNVITKEEASNIIKNELYVLNGKKSLSELTNQDKLWFSFRKYLDANPSLEDWPNQFKGAELTNIYNKTSLSHLGIKLEDINYFVKLEKVYKYNSKEDNYSRIEDAGAYGYNEVESIYQKVGEGTKNGSRYTFPVKQIWIYCEPAAVYFIYGKYDDALNENNHLTDDDIGVDKNYIKEKALSDKMLDPDKITEAQYEEFIKDSRVETYYYVLEKNNGKISIVDYYIK